MPLAGYFFLSFCSGLEGIEARYADLSIMAIVGITAGGSLIFGMWAYAVIFGGGLYLSARLFNGRHGFLATINAVGYGFFCPGAIASILSIMSIRRDLDFDLPILLTMVGFLLLNGMWAVFLGVVAIKAHHKFGWMRAIAAFLLPSIVYYGLIVFYVFITMS
jgi:hypothetical protein